MAEYRRHLPHFHPDGAHFFVTWRLDGSLPAQPLDVIYATPGHAFAAEDRALAQCDRRLWLSDTRVARQVADAIRAGESQKHFYELQASRIGRRRVTHHPRSYVSMTSTRARMRCQSSNEPSILIFGIPQTQSIIYSK